MLRVLCIKSVMHISGEFETQTYSSGKYVWSCGKTYEGTFKNGKPDGHGTMEHQVLFEVFLLTFINFNF